MAQKGPNLVCKKTFLMNHSTDVKHIHVFEVVYSDPCGVDSNKIADF